MDGYAIRLADFVGVGLELSSRAGLRQVISTPDGQLLRTKRTPSSRVLGAERIRCRRHEENASERTMPSSSHASAAGENIRHAGRTSGRGIAFERGPTVAPASRASGGQGLPGEVLRKFVSG